jgi:hypothetical protein
MFVLRKCIASGVSLFRIDLDALVLVYELKIPPDNQNIGEESIDSGDMSALSISL